MPPLYLFPFTIIPQNAKIIIYGGGYCGKQYVKQVLYANYAEVTLWVDINFEKIMNQEYLRISDPKEIMKAEFDYLVVAITDEFRAELAIKDIIANYHVPSEKIIHKITLLNDRTLYEKFSLILNPMEGTDKDTEELNPTKLVRSSNMDMAVRYLVARDFKNGIENPRHMSLYCRTLMAATGGHTEYYQGQFQEKNGTKDFTRDFRALFDNIRDNGFDKKYSIPVRKGTHSMIDGSHRLAVSLVLEKKIWVKYYNDNTKPYSFPFEWFKDNGFSVEDQLRILRAFTEIYPNCGLVILYGPVMEEWGFLTKQVAKTLNLVGYTDLDFSDNYIAFENLIREIYSDPLWEDNTIDQKIRYLKVAPLKIRVMVVNDESKKGINVFETCHKMKLRLREAMMFDTELAQTAIHSADTRDEFIKLRNIFLSPNNLKALRNRVTRRWSEGFVHKLRDAKDTLQRLRIPIDKVVIIGTCVLDAYGLDVAHDIDIVYGDSMKYEYGQMVDTGNDDVEVSLLAGFEYEGKFFDIDTIIEDDDYHFIFDDFKFVNLDILKKHMAFLNREKDHFRIRLIELFEDFALNFDDKRVLREQINEHLRKRFLS